MDLPPRQRETVILRVLEGKSTAETAAAMGCAAGTVKDPVVIASHPSNIFNRAALRAIRKWKYNPKIEDGVAVERPGVQVRLTFELEDE